MSLAAALLLGVSGPALAPPSFPRTRESSAEAELDSRFRGNDEEVQLALQDAPPEKQADPLPATPTEEGRRRPGVPQRELEDPVSQDNPAHPGAAARSLPTDQIPIPDRWRLIETLAWSRMVRSLHQNTTMVTGRSASPPRRAGEKAL